MKLKWGDDDLGSVPNNVRFLWVHEGIKNEAGYIVAYAGRCDVVEGWITASGQADAKTKMDTLFTSFKGRRRDLKFLNDDNTDTTTVITNANSEGGVNWDRLEWDDSPGAQYLTHRKFRAGFSWRIRDLTSGQQAAMLMDFREQISVDGGTDDVVTHRPVNRSTAILQVTSTAKVWTVTQTGHAVGYQHLPTPPDPVLTVGSSVKLVGKRINEVGGDRVGDAIRNRRIEWSYTFVVVGSAPTPTVNQWTATFTP